MGAKSQQAKTTNRLHYKVEIRTLSASSKCPTKGEHCSNKTKASSWEQPMLARASAQELISRYTCTKRTSREIEGASGSL